MKTLFRIFILAFVLALTGCVTTLTLRTLPADFELGANEESVVMGRVVFEPNIKPLKFFEKLNKMELEVENNTTGDSYIIVCDKGGYKSNFFVSLPQGLYDIKKINIARMEVTKGTRLGHFEVERGKVVYIGTLKFVEQNGTSHFLAGAMTGSFAGDMYVEDEYEAAMSVLHERYSFMNQKIVKSLIKLD